MLIVAWGPGGLISQSKTQLLGCCISYLPKWDTRKHTAIVFFTKQIVSIFTYWYTWIKNSSSVHHIFCVLMTRALKMLYHKHCSLSSPFIWWGWIDNLIHRMKPFTHDGFAIYCPSTKSPAYLSPPYDKNSVGTIRTSNSTAYGINRTSYSSDSIVIWSEAYVFRCNVAITDHESWLPIGRVFSYKLRTFYSRSVSFVT